MNEIVLRNQVRAQLAISSAVDTAMERLRDEEGQTSIEYVGIIAVVGLILAALLGAASGWGSSLASKVGNVISSIG
jgi:Flp pilus assembly pilin Flp